MQNRRKQVKKTTRGDPKVQIQSLLVTRDKLLKQLSFGHSALIGIPFHFVLIALMEKTMIPIMRGNWFGFFSQLIKEKAQFTEQNGIFSLDEWKVFEEFFNYYHFSENAPGKSSLDRYADLIKNIGSMLVRCTKTIDNLPSSLENLELSQLLAFLKEGADKCLNDRAYFPALAETYKSLDLDFIHLTRIPFWLLFSTSVIANIFIINPLISSKYIRYYRSDEMIADYQNQPHISEEDAELLIQHLIDENDKIASSIKINAAISVAILTVILPYLVHGLIIENQSSLSINTVSFTMILVALAILTEYNNISFTTMLATLATTIIEDYQNKRSARKLDNEVEKRKKYLKEILPSEIYDLSIHKASSIESSYFYIECKAYNTVSVKIVSQIIKNIFLKNGINFEYEHNSIILNCNEIIKNKLTAQLKDNILAELKKYDQAKQFSIQFIKIAKTMALECLIRPTKNDQGDYVYYHYLRIPSEYREIIDVSSLQLLFPNNKIEMSPDFLLTIYGSAPADQQPLDQMIEKILKKINQISSSIRNKLPLNHFDYHKQNTDKKYSKNANESESNDETSNKNKNKDELIEDKTTWKSGTYNPKDNVSNVKPFYSTQLPDLTFFGMIKIKKEDFGDRQQAYDKFKQLLYKGKVAKTRKGDDGLVFTEEGAKLKILDHLGKIRLHGHEEKSGNKVLYVFDRVEFKH